MSIIYFFVLIGFPLIILFFVDWDVYEINFFTRMNMYRKIKKQLPDMIYDRWDIVEVYILHKDAIGWKTYVELEDNKSLGDWTNGHVYVTKKEGVVGTSFHNDRVINVLNLERPQVCKPAYRGMIKDE